MLVLGAVFPPLPSISKYKDCKIDCNEDEQLAYCNGTNVIVRRLDSDELVVFSEHKAAVLVAKFSSCGTLIASGDDTGDLCVWNIERVAGKQQGKAALFHRKMWAGPIRDVAWNKDGKLLFVVGAGAVVLDVEREMTVASLNIHTKTVNCVAWRPGTNEACTGSDDFSIGIFGGSPIALQKTLNVHSNFVNQVAFSPSGNRMASVGSSRKLIVHNLGSQIKEIGNALVATECHRFSMYGVAWLNENQLATCSADDTVRFWSVNESGIEQKAEIALGKKLSGLVVHRKSNRCIVVNEQSTLTIIDAVDFKVEREISGHAFSITQLTFDKDHLYSVDERGCLCEDVQKRAMQLEEYTSICINNSNLAALTFDSLKLFAGDKNVEQLTAIDAMCHYKSNLWIVSRKNSLLRCLDFDSFKEIQTFSLTKEITQTTDGAVRMACSESVVILYSERQGLLFKFGVKEGFQSSQAVARTAVSCLALSPDSTLLAVGYQKGIIHVFSFDKDKFVSVIDYEWSVHCNLVSQICWRNNRELISCSVDGCIIQWSLDDRLKWKIQRNAHQGAVNCICIHPGKQNTLYSGGTDGCIKEWRLE